MQKLKFALITVIFLFLKFFVIVSYISANEPQIMLTRTFGRFFMVAATGRSVNVVLTVKIISNKYNRYLEVVCDGENNYFSSGRSIDGEQDNKVFDFSFNLRTDIYNCQAYLTRVNDSTRKFVSDIVEITIY
jgi:hypothetical protein